jgi:hypothetical protein
VRLSRVEGGYVGVVIWKLRCEATSKVLPVVDWLVRKQPDRDVVRETGASEPIEVSSPGRAPLAC